MATGSNKRSIEKVQKPKEFHCNYLKLALKEAGAQDQESVKSRK